ncbi:TrbG/VirB9 family P-type conjugative transfer protein [Haematobacter genomosp. 1]|uniref:TrbG/VirB9 family P-type conjugative transfer protein n=1 Tax=Haematobacter genomosp. 1 TaxID=366618 RepID=UPI0015C59CBA|nr:TrbG/VirB9 family P-type conjugative transfer protein [Haematobacter genomosp. 1]
MQTVSFHDTDVVRINTGLVTNTAVEFARGEAIRSVLVGDSESYEIDVLSSGNVISIKPLIGQAATNMTVYTDRRTYSFFLSEGTGRPPFRVSFVYPGETRRAATSAAPDLLRARDVAYQWKGQAADIRPLRVWNNGEATFFEFAGATVPSIFGVDGAGKERSVNPTTRGNVVRVRGLGHEFTLRHGDEVICIRRVQGTPIRDPQLVQALALREAHWR